MARGNRTDSGDPAWVKADYGGGEYGIKMVTNTRGKLRRVQWKQLYKDGSFNKLQIGAVGARVRTTERMREIERDKAEAKFAGKVKEKEQELKLAEKEINDTQEQADRSLRQRDMQARQAEKDLSVGHKRSLLEMSVALEKKRKIDVRGLEELDRDNRIKTRELVEKKLKDMQETLSEIQGEKLELERAVKLGKERLVVLRDCGDGWKTKYTEQKESGAQKMEEQIRELENGQKDKVKQIRAVEKKSTLFEDRCTILEDKLKERELQLEELFEERRQVYLVPFPS